VNILTEGTLWQDRIREILSRRQRNIVGRAGLKPSAVLVPIYERDGDLHIVLTKRSEDVEHHKGQISFPGGAYDKDDGDLETTALREAYEETGIHPEDVEILGRLDDQATFTSNFAIAPFVGVIPYPYEFTVSRKEVEELIEAPVTSLLDPACFSPQTQDSEGELHPWGYYRFGRHNIIGITARILKQFLDLGFR
jgi:8-oxo-dGTP pyrophosphatase MutT (NUDIX family)